MIAYYPKPLLLLLNYKHFQYFRDHSRLKTKNIDAEYKHTRIVKSIFKKAAAAITENESGVVLEGIGYFAPVRHPIRKMARPSFFVKKEDKGPLYNLHSDRFFYYLKMFPNIHNKNRFKDWSMDYMFRVSVKSALAKQLQRGKKYKLKFTAVRALLQVKKVPSFD